MVNIGHKGRVALVLLTVLLVVGIAIWQHYSRAKVGIRIGVLHSLSGPMAISEKPLVDAIQLAIEEANAEGGINGRKIEAVVVDCEAGPEYCAQAGGAADYAGVCRGPVRMLDIGLPPGSKAGGREAPALALLCAAI